MHCAPKQVFPAGIGLQDVFTLKQPFEVGCPDKMPVFREEGWPTSEGVDKVKNHGIKNKNTKDQQVGQHEEIGHTFDPNQFLECPDH